MPSATNRFGERVCKVCGTPPWPVCPWCGRLLGQIEESHRLAACRESARDPGRDGRIRVYQARAAAGLPLFDKRTKETA